MSIWPPVIWCVLVVHTLCLIAIRNGQPRPPYDFSASLLSALISFGLLYWGGFFNPIMGASR